MRCEYVEAEEQQGIPVTDLDDGDVGHIVKWTGGVNNIGTPVQRIGDILQPIGKPSGVCWDRVLTSGPRTDCRVKLMKHGDSIVFHDDD